MARVMSFTCERCGIIFEKPYRKKRVSKPYRFCSKVCAQRMLAPGNRSYAALHARWIERYGIEEADRRLERGKKRRSVIAVEHNTGRVLSLETRAKISASCTGIPNAVRGKTFDEFYGPDRAKELSNAHSRRLKAGYESGRIKPTARSHSAPTFRGVKLRSLLEQSAIEFLERRDGLVFGLTLIYEDPHVTVAWHDENGPHTYHPDLHDVVNDVVYEVKPARLVDRPPLELAKKTAAARSSLPDFRFLTDIDVGHVFGKRRA